MLCAAAANADSHSSPGDGTFLETIAGHSRSWSSQLVVLVVLVVLLVVLVVLVVTVGLMALVVRFEVVLSAGLVLSAEVVVVELPGHRHVVQ